MEDFVERALKIIKENNIKWVDLQFTDLPGRFHHITVSAKDFNEDAFKNGFGKLDGSSIRGFTEIYESDLVLVPVPETFTIVPWNQGLARAISKVYWGGGHGRFERDPRYVAEIGEDYIYKQGYLAYFGPEIEFFIFDKVELDISSPQGGTGYKIHSREAPWSKSGSFFIRFKEGYYPVPPVDQIMDVRIEIIETLIKCFGFTIEATHHEVATAGQGEIDFRYSTLVDAADKVQTFKYVVKNIAAKRGMIATFMPKPLYGDNGSGMHLHLSFWTKDGTRNLMYDPDESYAEISQFGRYVIGGILEHARSLSAIVSPTTNSYRRLVPGFEAPIYLVWSKSNRSAAIRVPTYYKGMERSKRIEFRSPDPACNPYLALAAISLAALDGVNKKIDLGDPIDENVYRLTPEKKRQLKIRELPRSLDEALDELESDNEYLKPVFSSSVLNTYIEIKREECRTLQQYPHPMEVYYYLDI
jgi:glutamine synthetase